MLQLFSKKKLPLKKEEISLEPDYLSTIANIIEPLQATLSPT